MGLDVYTHTIVGAELKDDEMFVRTETVPRRCAECPKAHAAQQKFCGECGLKFSPLKIVTTWTPNILAYLQGRGKGITPDDLKTGEVYGPSIPFFNVRSVQSPDDRDEVCWGVGVKFDGASMRNSRPVSPVQWAKLDAAKQKVEETLQSMGLTAREVSLYPVMYISY